MGRRPTREPEIAASASTPAWVSIAAVPLIPSKTSASNDGANVPAWKTEFGVVTVSTGCPLPGTLVYDPLEADYAPLVGAEHVLRPGPTLTIWHASR